MGGGTGYDMTVRLIIVESVFVTWIHPLSYPKRK